MEHQIVIPVGRFSYFVRANVENILEFGNGSSVEIIFLTSKDVEPYIQRALDEVMRDHRCVKVMRAPFNAGANHCLLLDWCMRQPELGEWIMTQHCDVFWTDKDWLNIVEKAMKNKRASVISLPNYQFKISNRRMPVVGDSFGVYKKSVIIDNNYSFQWANYSSDTFSPKTDAMIKSGMLRRINGDRFRIGDFLDGSVIMSLEMIAENPNMIRTINVKGYNHLIAFFRIDSHIHIDGTTMRIELPWREHFGGCAPQVWVDAMARYSFMTSLVFNRSEVANPLPWSLLEEIARRDKVSLAGSSICEWLRRYSRVAEGQTMGVDTAGIKSIEFTNRKFEF